MGDPGSGADRNERPGDGAGASAERTTRDTSSSGVGAPGSGAPARVTAPHTGWRARIFVFLTVSALWLLWSGPVTFHHTLLLWLWPASALLVVWLCDRLGMVNDETTPLELTLPTLAYVPWLALQVVSASVTVLRHAWWPGAHISPKTARVDSRARTDLGLASYANSITLTPGTLSLEAETAADRRNASILVHSLTAGGLEDLRGGAMDARIVRVEEPLRKHLEKSGAQPGAESGGAAD